MFYLYILYSQSSDLFYVGSSEDTWKRLGKKSKRVQFKLKPLANRRFQLSFLYPISSPLSISLAD
jgi:predicted GIY-YIG superfamily endonuclease